MSSIEDFPSNWIWNKVFTFRPKVSKSGNTLVATSDWRSQAFSLGFAGRTVIVDPQLRIVRIVYRRFWFAKTSRRIEFDWIQEVLYGYNDVSTGFGAHAVTFTSIESYDTARSATVSASAGRPASESARPSEPLITGDVGSSRTARSSARVASGRRPVTSNSSPSHSWAGA